MDRGRSLCVSSLLGEREMYVKSLNLANVKCFKNVGFDFGRPDGTYAGWTVFVGGNASGKSTILKTIALALVGPEAGRQLLGSPAGWILGQETQARAVAGISWSRDHDHFKKGGAKPGEHFEAGVRFVLETKDAMVTSVRSVEKRNQRGTRIQTAERGPWNVGAAGWFSAGYGPMRRLSGSSSESIGLSARGGVVSRFVTLFREDAALSESEAWLKTNHSRWLETKSDDLKALLDGVTSLLSDELLPHGMVVERTTVDHVFIQDTHGLKLPMRDISDGCRSIYATVLDLVHGMAEVYGVSELFGRDELGHVTVTRPGVVLIDEIEAHLHPAWQRDIPEWLKVHFPEVQFLVTTHSPLVAQAADASGLFVLPSHSDPDREPRQLDQDELEKLRLGRAEKTLLGTAFGLKTVRSHWANRQIERWKRLNAKNAAGAPLTSGERREYKKLREQMALAFEREQESL
jgi:hypothetical protein